MTTPSITEVWLSGHKQDFYSPDGGPDVQIPAMASWVYHNWVNSHPWTIESYVDYTRDSDGEWLPREFLDGTSLITEHFYELAVTESGVLRFRYRRGERRAEGRWGDWSIRLRANSRRALYGLAVKEVSNYQRRLDARYRRFGWPEDVSPPTTSMTSRIDQFRQYQAIESLPGAATTASAAQLHTLHECDEHCSGWSDLM